MSKLDEINAFIGDEHEFRRMFADAMTHGFDVAVEALQHHAANLYAFARAKETADAVEYQQHAASFALAARYLHHHGDP